MRQDGSSFPISPLGRIRLTPYVAVGRSVVVRDVAIVLIDLQFVTLGTLSESVVITAKTIEPTI